MRGASPTRAAGRWLDGGGWHQWSVGFVLIFGLIALWSLATPKYAAPDEPAQAIKAAATARLEFTGTPTPTPGTTHSPTEIFRVPLTIINGTNPACFAFHPTVSAGCAPPWRGYSGLGEGASYVARYPPLYYLVVGLPSLLTERPSVLIWMRLVSAALSAVFLAGAFVCAARTRHGRWSTIGVAVALTPMELFLASVVNPSGLEISSALCLWSAGLALAAGAAPAHRRALVTWAAVAAAVLVQTRGLSPLFLALIGGSLAVVAGWSRLVVLARRSDVRVGLVGVGVCSAFGLAWILGRDTLWVKPSAITVSRSASNLTVLHLCFDQVGLAYRGYIGDFGWLDTAMPTAIYLIWGVVAALLVAGAVLRSGRLLTALIVALVAVVIGLPTLLAYSQARQLGIVSQPRDILPLAVGVPVLSAVAITRRAPRPRVGTVAALGMAAAVTAVQAGCFVLALRRYRTGVNGPILTTHASWSPPVPWLLLIAAFLVLDVLLSAWWLGTNRRLPDGPDLSAVDQHVGRPTRIPHRPTIDPIPVNRVLEQ